jgi:hypothetical protein
MASLFSITVKMWAQIPDHFSLKNHVPTSVACFIPLKIEKYIF